VRNIMKAPLTRMGLTVAACVFIADQLAKLWVLYLYKLPEKGMVFFTDIFSLTMVWNRGVSFGLLRAEQDLTRWALVGLSMAIALMLFSWLLKAERRLTAFSYGLIIGGAFGNILDRVVHGAVADFLDFSGLHFPYVFNVADAAITIGVLILLIDTFRPSAATNPKDTSHAGHI